MPRPSLHFLACSFQPGDDSGQIFDHCLTKLVRPRRQELERIGELKEKVFCDKGVAHSLPQASGSSLEHKEENYGKPWEDHWLCNPKHQ